MRVADMLIESFNVYSVGLIRLHAKNTDYLKIQVLVVD